MRWMQWVSTWPMCCRVLDSGYQVLVWFAGPLANARALRVNASTAHPATVINMHERPTLADQSSIQPAAEEATNAPKV